MPRSRSKSPARRTRANPTVVSPAPASPEPAAAASPPRAAAPEPSGLDDAQIQLAIAVVILTAVWSQCKGFETPSLNGFATQCGNGFDFTVPAIPSSVPVLDDVWAHLFGGTMHLVATLHLVNTIVSNRNSGGFWLQNFATTLLAGYAVTIVPAILGGTTPVDAIFSDGSFGPDLKTFFVIWYLINYGVGPINYELWEKFTGIIHVGGALQVLMSFASLMFVSKAVGGAVGKPQDMFTQDWFRAVAGGLVAAGANGFFPLSKGFSLEKNAAFAPVFFLASDGFASIDAVVGIVLSYVNPIVHDLYKGPDGKGGVTAFYTQNIEVGAKLNGFVANGVGPVGGFGDHLGNFVIGMIAINFLFGSVVRPLIPVDTNDGFDVLGFVAKFTALIQLN